MIFEYLKKLFWKADEGSRKRKSHEFISNDSSIKKPCSRFKSSQLKINRYDDNGRSFKIVTESPDGAEITEKSVIVETKSDFVQTNQYKLLAATKANGFSDQYTIKKDSVLENAIDQSTLYHTHRLAEKKQYGEMLLNFMPSKTNYIDRSTHQEVNQTNFFQNMCTNKSQVPSRLAYHRNNLNNVCKNHTFLETSSSSLMQCQNCFLAPTKKQENMCSRSFIQTPLKTTKTNTLKDEISSKKVYKYDFINHIDRKYDELTKQCQKEVLHLTKIKCMLAKHNQSIRETVLEDHLNRSMKLCKIVLDEREEIQESKLFELTTEMVELINRALRTGHSNEILVQSFGLQITRKDIQTLAGLNWLNDEIINFYMNLLIERGKNKNYPDVYAMNTFFYPKLISGGHVSLKRWTRKIDIFSKDILVIPIHLGIHWCMSIVDFRNKSIKYFDSMGSPNYKCLQSLKQYLYAESIDKKHVAFNFSDWILECVKNIPQQMNGSDCGVFSCIFAEYVCANKSFDFSQDDMPYFRNKMVYEILTMKLI
ncbi:sentrin-specific protease 1-like [Copidosoma floridanum]|uniref:sentrin-specific protease 1-like n=1 Tax=Copidosoma floridanum TaxID=29053 RepID=UPI0006C9C7DE|nr:sentrin-specific protease 1-like [Copidosoma floridanum]